MIIANYELTEKITETPQVAVYKACHRKNPGRLLVLKILKATNLTDQRKLQFRQRIEHLRILNNPLVITPLVFSARDETCFMTQDYFPGVTLKNWVRGSKVDNPERGTLNGEPGTPGSSPEQALNVFFTIACGVASALDKVHEAGIIHGGIKPNNILVNPDTLDIRLIDFISTVDVRDVSHFIYDRSFIRETLAYTSPEQTGRINHRVVFSSDLYSLGVVFYEVLTGRLPFLSDDPLEVIHSHLAEEAPVVHEINPDIPPALSEIIAKLMLKEPEKRYQSSNGLLVDLIRCRDEYAATGAIQEFALESCVYTHRVTFISKMVGRDQEAETILDEYEQAAKGAFRSLFISGLSGIGKTRLIQELQKPIVRHRGYFTSGKFDVYQKNIPYSSLIQAFRNLMRSFLTESDERVALWKERILKAVGQNGKVLTDVISELEILLGPQPGVKPLPPVESLNRFHDVFDRFLACLASEENPLTLFIDDLQWCDAASFDFMANIFAGHKDHPYLFFLGAYRHNEVDSSHPLTKLVRNVREGGRPLKEIRLGPLAPEHCHEMVAYILDSPLAQTKALADFIADLSEGNPLFVSESLSYLHNEDLLFLDEDAGWRWDMEKIRRSNMPTTVVALFSSKIRRLPHDLINLLEYCACMGNTFSPADLSLIREMTLVETFEMLKPALGQGLLIENKSQLQFVHDKVQEAALSAIAAERRRRIHQQVGNYLRGAVPEGADMQKVDNLFAIVSHLNLGSGFSVHGSKVTAPEPLTLNGEPGTLNPYLLSDLNYHAGNKALDSLATEAANEYFNLSRAMLPGDCWEEGRYDRTFRIYQRAAKTELMCGNYGNSERLLAELLDHAKADLDKAECLAEQTTSLSSIGNFIKAIETANRGLAYFGKAIPDNPEEADARRKKLMAEIASKNMDVRGTILNMPFTTDRKNKIELAFYSELIPDLYMSGLVPQLYLSAAQSTQHCLAGGMDESVIYSFSIMGLQLGEQEEFEQAFKYEDLARDLSAKYPNTFGATRGMNGIAWCNMHSRSHPKEIVDYCLKSIQCGKNCGDLYNAGLSYGPLMWNLQVQGEDLSAIEDYAQECLQFSNRYHLSFSTGLAEAVQAGWIGPMKKDYVPVSMEDKLKKWEEDNHVASAGSYYVHMALAHYYLGEYEKAQEFLEAVRKYLSGLTDNVLKRQWHVFLVLNALKLYELRVAGSELRVANPEVQDSNAFTRNTERETPRGEGTRNFPAPLGGKGRGERALMDELMAEIRPIIHKIETWVALGPLLKPYLAFLYAELARVAGVQEEIASSGLRVGEVGNSNNPQPATGDTQRFKTARSLYFDAISIAHEQNYTLLEGHLNECLGDLLRDTGHHPAGIYFAQAERLYRKCRAERKEVNLLERYPEYFEEEAVHVEAEAVSSVPHTLPNLDLDYLMKSSLAISAEIELDALLKKIMNVVIQASGAQHGFLLIEEGGNLFVRAESHIREEQSVLTLNQKLEDTAVICKAIVRYVYRSGEKIIFENACRECTLRDSPDCRDMDLRSLLCLPLIKQSKMIGALYLENRLSASVFTSERSQMTELLTSQAAISLENAVLFDERRKAEEALKKSEQHYATTLASIGDAVIAADMTGSITFMNAVAEELTGWTLKDALSKPSEAVFRIINERTRKEVASPIKQVLNKGAIVGLANHTILVRKDGKEVPIDDSGAPIKDGAGKIIGIVLVFRDTTARRQAEREHERLSAIVESTDDAIIGKVLDGTVTSWNKAAEKMYGFTAVEMQGKSVLRIIPADRRKEFSRILGQLSRGEKIAHHDTVRVRKDGTRFDVSVTVAPIKNHYGEIVGASTIARDITERKRAEEALRASLKREHFLADLVRNASVAMAVGYADGRLGAYNPAFQKLTGYSEEELRSITWNTVLTPLEWREHEREKLSELHRTKTPVQYEKEYIRKDGSRVAVELVVHPFFDDTGNISQYYAFISDITEKKLNEGRMKASLKEKEALLKEIHHRVKNNLQIIYSMLNLQLPQIKDEQAIELFRESQNRVHSMALIHEKLYQSESLAKIDLVEYVRSLTTNLFLSYGMSERIVQPRIVVENVSLDIDTVIPCALIINELVSNSLKHAFPDLKRVQGPGSRDFNAERGTVNGEPFVQGEIRIEMRRGSEDQGLKVHSLPRTRSGGSEVKPLNAERGTLNWERLVVLTVSDNGVGLPRGIQMENCESLGLKLVSVLVKQIKGAIHLGERGGTEFVITFEPKK